MVGGHRGERVSTQLVIALRRVRLALDPACHLRHHSPHGAIEAASLLRSPPGWGGGDTPVGDQGEVKRGGEPARGRGEALRLSPANPRQYEVWLRLPRPIEEAQRLVQDAQVSPPSKAPLQPLS